MWPINLPILLAAACFSACQSASVAEISTNPRDIRLGNTVRYYQTSWQHLVTGVDMEEVQNTDDAVAELDITETTKVHIVVHGRESSVFGDFAETLKFSLALAERDSVIILVDWSVLSLSPYNQAVALVPFIASDLKDFIVRLTTSTDSDTGQSRQLNLNQLHLIGFDLGAHIVGIASRTAAARAIKITALDPAGESWGSNSQRLRSSDANTVEVLHTDVVGTRAYGLADEIGTLDIYINAGTRQPGCANTDNLCHHNRAYQVYAATVDTGGHLLALRCDSMAQANNNRCTSPPAVFVGTTELFKLQRGLYGVSTGNIYPYA